MQRQIKKETGRTASGRFKKGVSGNPGGRPKIEGLAEMREALLLNAPRAVEVLREILDDENAASSARLAAAQAILDRVLGKPTQAIDHSLTTRPNFEDALDDLLRKAREVPEEERPAWVSGNDVHHRAGGSLAPKATSTPPNH